MPPSAIGVACPFKKKKSSSKAKAKEKGLCKCFNFHESNHLPSSKHKRWCLLAFQSQRQHLHRTTSLVQQLNDFLLISLKAKDIRTQPPQPIGGALALISRSQEHHHHNKVVFRQFKTFLANSKLNWHCMLVFISPIWYQMAKHIMSTVFWCIIIYRMVTWQVQRTTLETQISTLEKTAYLLVNLSKAQNFPKYHLQQQFIPIFF